MGFGSSVEELCHTVKARWGGVALILSIIILYPCVLPAAEIETVIDLNYTYEQTHLGDDISEDTAVQQKYEITYDSSLTPLFDLLARVKVDLADTSGDDKAETSDIAPSLEIVAEGPKALVSFKYDASLSRIEEFEDEAESENYSSSYLVELEVRPDYWPEAKLKLERRRDFEEQRNEVVDRSLVLDLRKDINDLKLEFDLDINDQEQKMPTRTTRDRVEWAAKVAYQSTVWWDLDVDLVYEIKELYEESFTRGVFTQEQEAYDHKIQARLKKSLLLLPSLSVDLAYEYLFEQDLLLLESDYTLNQKFGLDAEWQLSRWLTVGAVFAREAEEVVNVPPEEKEEKLEDSIELTFDADPVHWLQISGQAEWEFDKAIEPETGGSVDDDTRATYEIAIKHSWGDWWDLTVSDTSEYSYQDDWLTQKEGTFKAQLRLTFLDDLDLDSTYELRRSVDYDAFVPLSFDQSREEKVKIRFDYKKDFTSLIQVSFSHEFGITWSEDVDEVLDVEEEEKLTENTKFKVRLADFIRDMKIEGEVTRKASDTKDDDEPMLVDITYALIWDWIVRDLKLEASFKYDDNGDTFDVSTFNTKVAWQLDNIDLSGEYQFDKTYSDDIVDEQRKLNLNMNINF